MSRFQDISQFGGSGTDTCSTCIRAFYGLHDFHVSEKFSHQEKVYHDKELNCLELLLPYIYKLSVIHAR